jgi:hypothetical protein|tara:strand:- start:1117 stop:1737 length:621 start_codon:yes stop_codon:yes gene_type:complete
MKYNREQIQKTVEDKGYKYFEDNSNKGYDVNIIGIRNSETEGKVTNRFDDLITISFKCEHGAWIYHEFSCTTDPGTHWVENVLNDRGVAILKPGQYRGSHKIRLHQGKYEALGQKEPMSIYRDLDLDGEYNLDEATVKEELIGINIHRATSYEGKTSTQIDKWSAGCQVIASNDDWHKFLTICKQARDIHGNSFSYTLINSKDIKG